MCECVSAAIIYCVCVSVLINEIQVVEHHAMSLANPLDRSTALRVIINSLLSYLSVNFKSSLRVHVAVTACSARSVVTVPATG